MGDMITLPRRLDGATGPALVAQLLDALQDQAMRLDASDTTHIGALGAQVLLSAKKTAQARDQVFELTNLQDRTRTQLLSMGLADLILPEEDI